MPFAAWLPPLHDLNRHCYCLKVSKLVPKYSGNKNREKITEKKSRNFTFFKHASSTFKDFF